MNQFGSIVNTKMVHYDRLMENDAQLKIRLPINLKGKIEVTAKQNKRSMNAEIVARLEATFIGELSDAELMKKREDLRKFVRDEIQDFLRQDAQSQASKK